MKKLLVFIIILFLTIPAWAKTYIKNAYDYGLNESNYGYENTQIIQTIIANMKSGEILVIPPGNYEITGIQFHPPESCGLQCRGNLITSQPVIIGPGTDYDISGLKVISKTKHEGTGIIIKNLHVSKINIRKCSNFANGVVVQGDGDGCVYNEIYFGQILNNQVSLLLTAKNGGWCNQNNFHGGRFTWWSDSEPYLHYKHIVIDNCPTHHINNNSFYSLSLEGGKGYKVYALDCEGWDNVFYSCRWEMGEGRIIYFGPNSKRNKIFWGYGLLFCHDVINDGYRNNIFASFSSRIEGGGKDGVLILCNTSSSYYPSLVLESSKKNPIKEFSSLP